MTSAAPVRLPHHALSAAPTTPTRPVSPGRRWRAYGSRVLHVVAVLAAVAVFLLVHNPIDGVRIGVDDATRPAPADVPVARLR